MKGQYLSVFLVLSFSWSLGGCSDGDSGTSEIDYDYSLLSHDRSYLVFLGDTQGYFRSMSNARTFNDAIGWIEGAFSNGYDISAVLHPGDITFDNTIHEWSLFRRAMSSVDLSMPVVYSSGNHEYSLIERNGEWRFESRILTHFPVFIHYPPSIMVDSYDGGVENVLVKVNIGSKEWYILSLEFGPRQEVLEWADRCVKKYPKNPFMVLTHAYLYNDTDVYSSNSMDVFQEWAPKYYFKDAGDGWDIWNLLIRKNDHVKLVLCGHVSLSAAAVFENDFGNKVLKLRFDPSLLPNGGDGWLQLLEFNGNDPIGDPNFELKGWIYNPITNKIMDDAAGNFTLNF